MNVIDHLRFEEDVKIYFENLENYILENFDEEDQDTLFEAIDFILDSDKDFNKLEAINNVLKEAKGVLNPSENTVSRAQKKGKQVPTKAEKNFSGEKDLQKVATEAADSSCMESKWKRPKEISWGARAADKVTWGKEVNKWFSSWK